MMRADISVLSTRQTNALRGVLLALHQKQCFAGSHQVVFVILLKVFINSPLAVLIKDEPCFIFSRKDLSTIFEVSELAGI